ncbi:hypothetical protein QFC21_003389 [Naganishia friedmannii]|uniref:Uncharacterized protein n=1 Tax=Naganishia friedmannii TaxID=89922 RepID=A0ACC2VRB6_9TREE|nr:hypothetical protein QFC21_003389 [Naganishia friedmannii]
MQARSNSDAANKQPYSRYDTSDHMEEGNAAASRDAEYHPSFRSPTQPLLEMGVPRQPSIQGGPIDPRRSGEKGGVRGTLQSTTATFRLPSHLKFKFCANPKSFLWFAFIVDGPAYGSGELPSVSDSTRLSRHQSVSTSRYGLSSGGYVLDRSTSANGDQERDSYLREAWNASSTGADGSKDDPMFQAYNQSNSSNTIPPIEVYSRANRSEVNGYPSLTGIGRDQYSDPRDRGPHASTPAASSSATPTFLRDKDDAPTNRHVLSPFPDGTLESFRVQASSERTSFRRLSDTEQSRHPPSPFRSGNVAYDSPHVSGVSSPSQKRPRLDLESSSSTYTATGKSPRRAQGTDSTHRRTGRSGTRSSSAAREANGEQSNELLGKVLPEVHPQNYRSLLNNAVSIEPGRIVNSSMDDMEQGPDTPELLHHGQLESRASTAPPLEERPNMDKDGNFPRPPWQSIEGVYPTQSTVRDPNEAPKYSRNMASPRSDELLSNGIASSPQSLIYSFCDIDEEASGKTQKPFRISCKEYTVLAQQLGYGHLGLDETEAAHVREEKQRSKPPRSCSSDFWAEILKLEDGLRKEEEDLSKQHNWCFPPRDREMARRVIDKFFENINSLRPIIDEEHFKLEYGRLSKVTRPPEGNNFQPEFLACAHMVLALGTAVMDLEARQTKSALMEFPISNLPITFAPDKPSDSKKQDGGRSNTIHSAAAMSDRPVPANNFVFPLGHSTLFDKNDVDENIDGVGKDDKAWPSAIFFFQRGMGVTISNPQTSLQDLQRMIMVFLWYSNKVPVRALWRLTNNMAAVCLELGLQEDSKSHGQQGQDHQLRKQMFYVCYKLDQDVNAMLGRSPTLKCHQMSFPSLRRELYHSSLVALQLFELSHVKGEILELLYDNSLDSGELLDATAQTIRKLDTFYHALPEHYRSLHDTWIAARNILEEGQQTSSQGRLSADEMFAAAHIILEYTITYNLCLRAVYINDKVGQTAQDEALRHDALVLLNATYRGFDDVPKEEVRVVTQRAVQMLWDTRWSTTLRPVQETARILQSFHQVFFHKAFPVGEAGLQEEHKQYRPDSMKA